MVENKRCAQKTSNKSNISKPEIIVGKSKKNTDNGNCAKLPRYHERTSQR